MRAAWYETAGAARDVLTIGEMPDPVAGPGEVLVRVAVSSVHPSDVKLRAGGRPGVDGIGWPRIVPHSDGAGTIEAVGAGIDAARIGQRVWLWNGQWQRAQGTCAELIALPAAQAVALPDAASFEAGACMGIPAMTAHACLFPEGDPAGKTVLITGGAGAVSFYAIQMAKAAGARVLTTISSEEKAAYAKDAGAEIAIDYRREDVAAAVMAATDGQGIDHAIDLEFGSNVEALAEVIRPNGTIVAYGSAAMREPVLPFYTLMFKRVTLRTELVYLLPDAPRRAGEAYLTDMLSRGALRHEIAARHDLEDIAAAHELVESGNRRGCVLITLS
jgi:NADPH2:quinone reductase